MDKSDEAGRIASDYMQRHGGEAILHIDADIAEALAAERWLEHNSLLRARLRLRKLQLFEQVAMRVTGDPPGRSAGVAA